MQLCDISWFLLPEYLIMPSIACIIPFGSIWAGAASQHANLQKAMANAPTRCTNCSELSSNRATNPDVLSGNTAVLDKSPSSPLLGHDTKFVSNSYNEFDERSTGR